MKDPLEYFEALAAERRQLQHEHENRHLHLLKLNAKLARAKKTIDMLLDLAYISPSVQGIVLTEWGLLDSPEGREFLARVKKKPQPI